MTRASIQNLFVIEALSAAVGLLGLAACGSDGLSSQERQELCGKDCGKLVQCGEEYDQVECEEECNLTAQHLIGAVVRAQASCHQAHTCDELAEGACDGVGLDKCNSDDSVVIAAYCDRYVDCVGDMTKEECMEELGGSPFLKCVLQKDVEAIGECVRNASCWDLDSAVDDCFDEVLGRDGDQSKPPVFQGGK